MCVVQVIYQNIITGKKYLEIFKYFNANYNNKQLIDDAIDALYLETESKIEIVKIAVIHY